MTFEAHYAPLIALAVAGIACVTDLRGGRIPNALTFGAAVAAVIFHATMTGLSGVGTAGGGWLVGALVFFPFFALGGMGAGDVKLLAAIGAWLGPMPALWVGLYASVAGGVLGLVVACARGYLRTTFRNIASLFMFWWTSGIGPAPGLTLDSSTSPRLAYAVPIGIGLGVTLWLR